MFLCSRSLARRRLKRSAWCKSKCGTGSSHCVIEQLQFSLRVPCVGSSNMWHRWCLTSVTLNDTDFSIASFEILTSLLFAKFCNRTATVTAVLRLRESPVINTALFFKMRNISDREYILPSGGQPPTSVKQRNVNNEITHKPTKPERLRKKVCFFGQWALFGPL